jgi:hypothetical protein
VETATFRIEAEGVLPGSARSRLVAVIQRGRPGGGAGVTVRQWRPVTDP